MGGRLLLLAPGGLGEDEVERRRRRNFLHALALYLGAPLLLFVLIVLAAIGAIVSVIRGVIVMLRTNHEDVTGTGVSQSGLRQNRMMWRRVQFQALAIIFVVLFLLVARGHAG